MPIDLERSEADLARSLNLFTWWGATAAQAGGAPQPMQQLRKLVAEAQSALHSAGQVRAESVAELNRDLPVLVLEAAKARDPQAMLEAQLEIATRIRRCGAACARAWVDMALASSSWPPGPAPSATERANEDRRGKRQAEASRA